MRWGSRTGMLALWFLVGCARSAAGLAEDLDSGIFPVGGGSDGGTAEAPMPDASKPDKPTPAPTEDAGSGPGADEPDAAVAPSCQALNMCASARGMTSVAGDTDRDTSMTTGTRSEWLNITVTDTTLTGSRLAADLTLTSSGGANYDLFVLKPDDAGGASSAPKDCGATPMGSQNASGADTVSLSWDDQNNALGQSAGDGLVLSIEVRHVSGPCGSWSLLVQGNP